MSLRRRKPPVASTSPDELDSDAPKGKTFVPPQKRFNHPTKRQLFLLIPFVLLSLYLLSRSTAPPNLGSHYALCTREADGIITMNEDDPSTTLRTQCIVVKRGKVVGIGLVEEVREKWGDAETRGNSGIKIVWTKKGETVLPGLIDSHAHVLQYGESESAVSLVGASSVVEVRERIANYIDSSPLHKHNTSQFILGLGWDQTKFTDTNGNFPTALDLDSDPRLQGRPIYLKRIDVHALWVSPAILALLPPTLPKSVQGGSIIRNAVDERPTGVFLDNAMSLITAVIPPWNDVLRLSYLRATSRKMLSYGLTSVHDASLSLSDIKFLRTLDEKNQLPIRIYGMLSCDTPLNRFCGDEEGSELYTEGNKFELRAVKLFVDGALGSWGSAMHEPYSDNPEKGTGILICEEAELMEIVKKWVERGYQVNSHGIGDHANTLILQAYDAVLRNSSIPQTASFDWKERNPLRLRIEHAQILRVEDIEWMGRMGVIASFQPTHATSDMDYVEKRIGPERVKGAYVWRQILASGAPYCLGSDFPVEEVDPFLGLYASITRKYSPSTTSHSARTGSPHGANVGWYAEEALSPLEALRGFTRSAAEASFQETRVGTLRVGMEADFVVVEDGDVLELGLAKEGESEEEMNSRERRLGTMGSRVRATVVGGRVMYGRLV